MLKRALIVLTAVTGLVSCATAPQTAPTPVQQRVKVPDALPDQIGEQGLLVGLIAANGVAAGAFQELSFSLAGVQIDNVHYANAVRNGYLILPLKPGSYTLESLHVFLRPEDRAPTLMPLKYKFDIESGRATNLGVIALVSKQGEANRYWKLRVDNNAEMEAYLRRHHPKLAASLGTATPVLASDATYVDGNVLEALRRDVARDAWLSSEDPDTAQYVGSDVGTIAKLLRNSQGKIAAFDVLDSGTTAAMVSCSGDAQRYVCSSPEPALYFVQGSRVEKRALPVTAAHVWVHLFPPRGIALVDEHMNVYTSTDNGASWSKHVWHARKKALHPMASIKFANGRNGYYLYATFNVDPLAPEVIYSEYARTAYRKVEIPKLKNWQRLIETPSGLLLGPHNPDAQNEPSRLYFRPGDKAEWQARPLPGTRCVFLQREGDSHERLRVFCDSKFYTTADADRTWTERVMNAKK